MAKAPIYDFFQKEEFELGTLFNPGEVAVASPEVVKRDSFKSVEKGIKETQHNLILEALKENPLTDSELSELLKIDKNVINARRGELCQMNKVIFAGTKKSIYNKPNTVWRAL